MGHYEFNRVVLNFNGSYGGINQFSLPHGESTSTRDALEHSNDTPYHAFDRVGDLVNSAQRAVDANLSVAKVDDPGLLALLAPPELKLDAKGKMVYMLPKGIVVGGKGEVKLMAFTKDGKPLPAWIKFNPAARLFDIAMPDDMNESVEVQIVATDDRGDQAQTKVKITPPMKKVHKTAFIGKSSLSSQIKSALTLGQG
jgi:hypothetical protein